MEKSVLQNMVIRNTNVIIIIIIIMLCQCMWSSVNVQLRC